MSDFSSFAPKICVVGLGYVGLPLAVSLGKKREIYGFDINSKKIEELKNGFDSMKEVASEELGNTKIVYSDSPEVISQSNFIIAAVPTPITKAKTPDLFLIEAVSKTIGQNLKSGSIVVFESTVYPGVTEDICIPIIEKYSGLRCGEDWKIGYSPERINPGDKEHTFEKIVKVVSGMDQESLDIISAVYEEVVEAGVHRAATIKTAEAAKVIENTQRDLNIALMNELSLIFQKLNIDTRDVLKAAGTKWNFLKFSPGLVGGHCIGVDPYYLTYKAEEIGIHPQIISAGRRVNDYMPIYMANKFVKNLITADVPVRGSKVLILGLSFKPDVKDCRNSKIEEVIHELSSFGIHISVSDPLLDNEEISAEFGNVNIIPFSDLGEDWNSVITFSEHSEVKNLIETSYFLDLQNSGKLFRISQEF